MVILVHLTLVLEARVVDIFNDTQENRHNLIFRDGYPVPVVRPVDDLYLVTRPKRLQWGHHPSLHLEVIRH